MIFSVPTKDGKQNVLLDNIFDEDMTFGKICRFERNGHTIFSLTDNPPKDAVPVKDFSLTMALTYAIVDEISAERGDVADHGWLDTEFQPHSLHGSTLSAKRPEGYDHVVSPEEAESLGERFDISGRRDMGSGDFRCWDHAGIRIIRMERIRTTTCTVTEPMRTASLLMRRRCLPLWPHV